MTRFEIKGLKQPRGAGSGWETREEAENFFMKYVLTERLGRLEDFLAVPVCEVKVEPFEFSFDEPKVEVKKRTREEEVLMPFDDEEVGSTVLVKTGKQEVFFELFVDGTFEGSFASEEQARRFAKTLGKE